MAIPAPMPTKPRKVERMEASFVWHVERQASVRPKRNDRMSCCPRMAEGVAVRSRSRTGATAGVSQRRDSVGQMAGSSGQAELRRRWSPGSAPHAREDSSYDERVDAGVKVDMPSLPSDR